MNKKRWIIGLVLFVAFIGIAAFAYNKLAGGNAPSVPLNGGGTSASQSGSAQNNVPAPDFTVYDRQGNAVNLSSFEGKPVVLNFWASWCPPCKREMPVLERVYNELGSEVTFLMVDLVDGSQETEAAGKQFIDENSYTFPVYFDTTQEAAIAYGIRSIPTTFFIDAEGNVVGQVVGEISEAALRSGIEKATEA